MSHKTVILAHRGNTRGPEPAGENTLASCAAALAAGLGLETDLRRDNQLVRNLIYPVPDPTFPFLGVHFTRLIRGGIEAGPNAVLAFAREGYSKWRINAMDLADAVFFKGLWNFIKQHKVMAWEETRRSFSRRLFCRSLQRLVPEVQESDLETGGAGVRAQAMLPDGSLLQDFNFVEHRRALHVLNTPSPAATAW